MGRTAQNPVIRAAVTDNNTQRQMLADYCRVMGVRLGTVSSIGINTKPGKIARAQAIGEKLTSERDRETLDYLLAGDSEKQIALRLGISRHTVHAYVKRLYKHFNVNSRGELLAKFVQR